MSDWTSELRSISDFCDETTVVPAVPDASNKIGKRKFTRSLYDYYDSDDDDDIQLKNSDKPRDLVERLDYPKYRSGRGYLIQKGYSTKMVGNISPALDFRSDTTNAIRSVSNIDYSNDILESTFKGHNKEVINKQFLSCVDSATLVSKEVSNQTTPKIEPPPIPLSELLKNCQKAPKQVKLNKLSSSKKNNQSESAKYLNGKEKLSLKNEQDLKEDLLDLQSRVEFPSLS